MASGNAYAHCQIRYGKVWLSFWDSYGLKNYHHSLGSMSEGARVRWTITIYATPKHKPMRQLALFNESIGIDLGLREFAAASDSTVVEARLFYRALEKTLAIAQRANKNDEIKTIHAKIAHRRKDFQQKLGARLVQAYGAIFGGNVKPLTPCENDPGQIGSGLELECIPDHAAVQLR
ncbi:transposase [Noviherbaspirillum soli]|uniref:transposase n=1 Tax=Noviherbaspirillum soli TaxID=1064518 RepID=UPI001E5F805A|nr:transposase [Noviherbaspirillum soli]